MHRPFRSEDGWLIINVETTIVCVKQMPIKPKLLHLYCPVFYYFLKCVFLKIMHYAENQRFAFGKVLKNISII
jgi:hypothetical protein